MRSKYIYYLSHPSSDKYYIGQAYDLSSRYKAHIRSNNKNNKKDLWIMGLANIGLIPEITMLCKVGEDQADFFEIFYIDLFLRLGFELVNGTLGGSYNSGGHTEETKHKISESNKGKKMLPHVQEAILKSTRGRKAPFSERIRISARLIDNKYRVGIAPVNKGKRRLSLVQVEEIKNKLKLGFLGRELAKEYSVPESTISTIRNGKYFETGWGYSSSAESWKSKSREGLQENLVYLFS